MKRYAALLCCGVLLFWWLLPGSPAAVSAAEEPEIPAAAYALLEAETGTVLLESHGSDRLPCGAMAKLMTALLAAEQLEQGAWTTDTVLTATDAVTGTKGAVIWLTAGEEMTVGDLLKGLIVGNANDAAVVLAAAAAGDTKQFVMDMNARAFDLGMRDTWFTSPQGDTDTSYTTAADLGRLCCALAKKTALQPYFRTWRDFLRGEATELVNENTFSRTDETSIGFKACHSEAEGWSIAAGARRNGMQCVAVVLGCGDTDSRFTLAKQLLRKGFAGWKVVQPQLSGEFLYPVQVRGGVERAVLAESGPLKGLVVPRSCTELETVMVLPRFVQAPVRKGQKLGHAAFYQGDTLLYETHVAAADAVPVRDFWDALYQITVKMLKM